MSRSARELVREALAVLGVRRLLLGVHEAALPGREGEDVGRGSPGSDASADFLEFVALLGFDGLQLGPSGMTSSHDPSPYDGTCFSRDPLALALRPLAGVEWGGLLSPRTFESLVAGRPGRGERTELRYTEQATAVAIDEALAAFRRACAAGGRDHPPPLLRAIAAFREVHGEWLERDALYEPLREAHGGVDFEGWLGPGAELDRRLHAPLPGEERRVEERRRGLLERHAAAVERHVFVQFLLHEEHRRFQARARRKGLSLFGDLQVGMSDRDAWGAAGFLLPGWRLGAPPSRTNPEGQPWNYPLLDPRRFVEEDEGGVRRDGPAVRFLRSRVRKAFAEHDGLRIDHPHGLVCPWVYRAEGDAGAEVRAGARLYDSPDRAELSFFAIPRLEQLDQRLPRHADGWVRSLEEAQVDRYAALFEVIMEAAREEERREEDVVCEVLSTLPHPLRRVMERHGLGRFRVTQKADLDHPDDVYRTENARPEDWVLLGNHDTRPILAVAEEWVAAGASRRRAERLAGRLAVGEERGAFAARVAADPRALAQASFAELFAGPARNVMVYFTDLFGEREPYNRPGTVACENWSHRVPPDFRGAYAARLEDGRALDLPRALARALRARFGGARAPLAEALEQVGGGGGRP